MVLEMEMSKTYQYRKVMKPLLERKRRARINKCLDELKDLMVECLTQEGEHVTRLEKADILELTVEHLRKMKNRKQQLVTESFRSGYIQAANEVSKALAATPGVDVNLGTQLMTHLGHRLNQIQESVLAAATIAHSPATSSSSSSSSSVRSVCTPPTSPLNVVCETVYSAPMSPASSGYESEMDCPESISKGLLQIADSTKESMWRPW